MTEAARLTRADIIGRKTTNREHFHFGGGRGAWSYGVEGVPRLTVWDETARGKSTRTWQVDGNACCSLDAALAVINGEMSPEEAMKPTKEPQRKVSLGQQIEEVDRELKQREAVYPRLVSSGKMRQAIADYQVDRLKAVRATLVWLQCNELHIKQRASY